MRRTLIGAAVLSGALLLASCSSGPSTPSPVQQPAAVAPTTAYVSALNAESPDFAGIPAADLIGLGNGACQDLSSGSVEATLQDGLNTVNDNPSLGLTTRDIGVLIGSSVVYLCPQYRGEVQAWLNNNGYTTQ